MSTGYDEERVISLTDPVKPASTAGSDSFSGGPEKKLEMSVTDSKQAGIFILQLAKNPNLVNQLNQMAFDQVRQILATNGIEVNRLGNADCRVIFNRRDENLHIAIPPVEHLVTREHELGQSGSEYEWNATYSGFILDNYPDCGSGEYAYSEEVHGPSRRNEVTLSVSDQNLLVVKDDPGSRDAADDPVPLELFYKRVGDYTFSQCR